MGDQRFGRAALTLLAVGCGASERPGVYPVGLTDVFFALLPDASCTPVDAGLGVIDLRPPLDGGVDWSCFSQARPAPRDPFVILRFTLLRDGAPTQGFVRVCAADDVMCAAPLASATTDPSSGVTLSVPTGRAGFDGFVEITGANFLPTRTHIWPPLAADFSTQFFVSSAGSVSRFPEGDRVRAGSRGLLAAVAKTCQGRRAAGVRIELDGVCPGTARSYDIPSGWTPDASATGDGGEAVFSGLPQGEYRVSSYRTDTGGRLGTRRVFVRAGWVTGIAVTP
ncbi:MAG: hypothetical protein U0325_08310 [Polyangiales bacterium]